MTTLTVVVPAASLDAGEVVVTVEGEVDMHTAHLLETALGDLLDKRPRAITVDIAKVEFCSSDGLAVMLEAQLRAESLNLPLAWVSPSPTVKLLLRLAGVLDKLTLRGADLDNMM